MKVVLNNGRTFEVGALPLDERGDAVAALLDAVGESSGKPFSEQRRIARDLSLAAIKLFAPTATDAEILSGLDMAIAGTIIIALNGQNTEDA